MLKPSKPYDIGGVTFDVRSLENGEQQIVATNLGGKFDEQGFYQMENGDVEPAVSLVFKMIQSAFKADIYAETREDQTIFQVRRHTTNDPMQIKNHLPKRLAPIEMVDRIVEVKKYPGGKRSLDDDVFAELMQKLSEHFATPEKAHKAYQQLAIQEERRRRASKTAKDDQRAARAEQLQYKPSFDQVNHLLRPIVLTLAQHGIRTDDELTDGIIVALLDTHSKADENLRKDPSAMAREYVNQLATKISQQGLHVEDHIVLESDLLNNICEAEVRFRLGRGKTG